MRGGRRRASSIALTSERGVLTVPAPAAAVWRRGVDVLSECVDALRGDGCGCGCGCSVCCGGKDWRAVAAERAEGKSPPAVAVAERGVKRGVTVAAA